MFVSTTPLPYSRIHLFFLIVFKFTLWEEHNFTQYGLYFSIRVSESSALCFQKTQEEVYYHERGQIIFPIASDLFNRMLRNVPYKLNSSLKQVIFA